MKNSFTEPCSNSEIDLQSLMRSLWHRKWLILSVMLLSMLIASLYAYTARPVYEAKLFLLQPMANDIANINYGRTQESGLEPLKANAIYQIFLQVLDSQSLRQDFFNNVYLPSLSNEERHFSQGKLYQNFSKSLSVKLPTKDTGDRTIVVMENGNPDKALGWAQTYVDHASTMAEAEIYKDVSSESALRARNLFQRIESLREVSHKLRQDSVTRLREALRVAEAIGLETPPVIMGGATVELAESMDGQALYMRGSKALKAEIETLEQRKSDDPFSIELRKLESSYSFYKKLELNRPDISVYRQDGVALHPDSPIKPKKILIVALGLMLGLMIGVGVALVFWIKKR